MDQPLWRRLRDEALSVNRRAEAYADEHARIYEAIVAGDPEASALFAKQHVRNVRKHMSLE
jgi:DNA-binding GntR family transcriptional regulator